MSVGGTYAASRGRNYALSIGSQFAEIGSVNPSNSRSEFPIPGPFPFPIFSPTESNSSWEYLILFPNKKKVHLQII